MKIAQINSSQYELVTPLIWQNEKDEDWFYTKQEGSNIWLEISIDVKLRHNFTEIASFTDPFGFPIVVLKRMDIEETIKLNEGKACLVNVNEKCSKQKFAYGNWTKKEGKNIHTFLLYLNTTVKPRNNERLGTEKKPFVFANFVNARPPCKVIGKKNLKKFWDRRSIFC